MDSKSIQTLQNHVILNSYKDEFIKKHTGHNDLLSMLIDSGYKPEDSITQYIETKQWQEFIEKNSDFENFDEMRFASSLFNFWQEY